MNRRIVCALLLLLLVAAPLPARAFPGPPLTPQDRFCNELNYLVPRAYVFTPYWGQTADPALRTVLESVILDPEADVAGLLATAAQEAQAALDDLLAQE